MTDGEEARSTTDLEQFIPVRKSDILSALVGAGTPGCERGRTGEILPANLPGCSRRHLPLRIFPDLLETLPPRLFLFQPRAGYAAPRASIRRFLSGHSYRELLESFVTVLKGANFVEVSHEEIERRAPGSRHRSA